MSDSSKVIKWSAKPLYSEYAGSSSLNDSGNSSPNRLSPNSGFKRRESDVSETTVVHGLQRHKEWGAEMVPPISLGTTYKWKPVIPDEEVYHALSNGEAHVYGRYGNPTRTALEKNLAALEDGKFCRVYSSGMSACAALINVLKTGDHIIVANNIYGGVQSYLNNVSIAKHGIDVAYVDFSDLGNLSRALKDTSRMVWLENPSNPLLQVVDIQAISNIAKAYNKEIIVVVDNTIMTPYFQKPLSLGACAVVHSVTKYLNGHTDALMGAIVTNSDLLDNHCFEMQYTLGAVPSPFDCYLVHRSLKTLHLRMQSHMDNALAIARWLETNPRVEKVLYPELPSHPNYVVHKKQSMGMSGMVSFYIDGGLEEAHKFLTNLKLFTPATSLGGCESLAEAPFTMQPAVTVDGAHSEGITPNLIRLSVGCENKGDLMMDLEDALRKAVGW